jgi:hypothetical protein
MATAVAHPQAHPPPTSPPTHRHATNKQEPPKIPKSIGIALSLHISIAGVNAVTGLYKLGRTLGEGTYGKVKLGTHMYTGQEVSSTNAFTATHKITKNVQNLRMRPTATITRFIRHLC